MRMRYKTYLTKMQKHDITFTKVWKRMLQDTNTYIESNPTKTGYHMSGDENNPLDIAEHLIFNGIWIIDRIEGLQIDDKKSLRYKIRKVLGYTYP